MSAVDTFCDISFAWGCTSELLQFHMSSTGKFLSLKIACHFLLRPRLCFRSFVRSFLSFVRFVRSCMVPSFFRSIVGSCVVVEELSIYDELPSKIKH